MNAQMETHGGRHEEEQHARSTGVEAGEQHEKKSVLKKVKAKAKKIKDTITKHGHGGRIHEEDDDDDDDSDGDDEVVEEHQGAPIHESKEVRSYAPGKEAPGIFQGDTVLGGGDRTTTAPAPLAVEADAKDNLSVGHATPTAIAPVVAEDHGTEISDANSVMSRQGHELKDNRGFIPEQVGVSKHDGISTFGGSQTRPVAAGTQTAQKQSLGYDTFAHGTDLPLSSGPGLQQQGGFKEKTGIFDRPTPIESDPRSPRGQHQQADNTHWKDPTGREIGATPALHSLVPEQQSHSYNTSAHGTDQKTGIFDRPTPIESESHSPRMGRQPDYDHSKDPTGRGGEEIGATPVLNSLHKLAIYSDEADHGNAKTRIGQQESLIQQDAELAGENKHSLLHDQFSAEPKSDATSLFPLYPETEHGVTDGAHEIEESGPGQHEASYTDKVSNATSMIADRAIQAKNVVASKIGYEGEDHHRPMSSREGEVRQQEASYTNKVSNAASVIADKAIQAKNVVASKMGYEGEDHHRKTSMSSQEGEVDADGMIPSVIDYDGKKAASTVQAKQAPMYDKVPGVGTEGSMYEKGMSAKDYIAEKVSPGEEDKALSEVISGALHKDTDIEGEDEKKDGPRGKVTISAKVARQLGRGDERSPEELGSGGAGRGKTVVESLRGTVTSWLGMGGGDQSSTQPSTVGFHDIPKEAEEGSGGHGADGERRLK